MIIGKETFVCDSEYCIKCIFVSQDEVVYKVATRSDDVDADNWQCNFEVDQFLTITVTPDGKCTVDLDEDMVWILNSDKEIDAVSLLLKTVKDDAEKCFPEE